jgi:hypothetical protein
MKKTDDDEKVVGCVLLGRYCYHPITGKGKPLSESQLELYLIRFSCRNPILPDATLAYQHEPRGCPIRRPVDGYRLPHFATCRNLVYAAHHSPASSGKSQRPAGTKAGRTCMLVPARCRTATTATVHHYHLLLPAHAGASFSRPLINL